MTFKLIARCFWSESGKRLRLLEAERIKQPNGTRVNIQILYRQWIRQNEHNQKRFKSENCLVERQVLIPMIKKHWPGSYKPNGEKKKKHIFVTLHWFYTCKHLRLARIIPFFKTADSLMCDSSNHFILKHTGWNKKLWFIQCNYVAGRCQALNWLCCVMYANINFHISCSNSYVWKSPSVWFVRGAQIEHAVYGDGMSCLLF